MKFTGLLTLCVTSCLAAVGTEHRRAQIADKIASRHGGTSKLTTNPFIQNNNPVSHGLKANYESTNWAGAAKSQTGFTAVTADTIVPVPAIPSGGNTNTAYYATAWVGIDGFMCENAILQTGFDIAVQGSETAYQAWYEWYPDYSYNFDLPIAAGDQIRMTIDATTDAAGTATIENLTTGQAASHTFTGQQYTLCETDVEWIVERFTEVLTNGQQELVPFANYGSFTFTNCAATQNGAAAGLGGSDMIYMTEGGSTVSECSIESNTELVCQYTG